MLNGYATKTLVTLQDRLSFFNSEACLVGYRLWSVSILFELYAINTLQILRYHKPVSNCWVVRCARYQEFLSFTIIIYDDIPHRAMSFDVTNALKS